ncbi:MAG TPA: flagellar biosynthesis protein FliQ [Deltaproteobacteria bacterium]|jgi:flagellar biosynthetic protein FliQ|nr:flagellar biosynthesis protein FliQ [Deltaproteobacteria bacterium]HQJ09215.1 flagellar biosynthesis protein FliQ [Deltaproteobacteria bacterium]
MTPEAITSMMAEAIRITLLVSAPMLLVGLIVGLAISVFSAVTQIQEMTLTFVPKIVMVFLALLFTLPWMIEKLTSYTVHLFSSIPMLVR